MSDIIGVELSKNTSPNYANPDEVIVSEGDKIKFISLDAAFEVEFINPYEVIDSYHAPIIITPTSKEEETTTGEFLPNGGVCYYRVKLTEKPGKGGPGRAKMTVKAIR